MVKRKNKVPTRSQKQLITKVLNGGRPGIGENTDANVLLFRGLLSLDDVNGWTVTDAGRVYIREGDDE